MDEFRVGARLLHHFLRLNNIFPKCIVIPLISGGIVSDAVEQFFGQFFQESAGLTVIQAAVFIACCRMCQGEIFSARVMAT